MLYIGQPLPTSFVKNICRTLHWWEASAQPLHQPFSDENNLIFHFLKVHGDHQYTVEDEKKIDQEIEELERKIKAVSSENFIIQITTIQD